MKNIYFNNDGNTDDLVSLILLLQAPDINLIGVSLIDADGAIEPATRASRKIIDRFNPNNHQIEVAKSNSRPVHQFPEIWRQGAFSWDNLPILNESGTIKTPESPLPAHLDMIEKIMKQPEKTTLVMTGPLTDLARALEVKPELATKIERLYWMGGSLDGHGNVVLPGFDGTQEWNAFWDPEAVAAVWQAGLDIWMVGLESSEQLPLNQAMRDHLAQRRRFLACDLIGQGYALVVSSQAGEPYYLWDVLTTLVALDNSIVNVAAKRSTVNTNGAAAGRLEENKAGFPVTLVTAAKKDAFWNLFDQLTATKQD